MRDSVTVGFHYLLWEDWRNGMYGSTHRDDIVGDCATLLRASQVFGDVLQEVARQWPVATAQNLSDPYRNHQPWCGRAACSYEFGATIPEVNTAWADLSAAEQVAANQVADAFTYLWRSANMSGQLKWPL